MAKVMRPKPPYGSNAFRSQIEIASKLITDLFQENNPSPWPGTLDVTLLLDRVPDSSMHKIISRWTLQKCLVIKKTSV